MITKAEVDFSINQLVDEFDTIRLSTPIKNNFKLEILSAKIEVLHQLKQRVAVVVSKNIDEMALHYNN